MTAKETSRAGERILRLRRQKGLTQKELGAPRYTHAYVSSIERGHRPASRAALEHFASKLGVDVGELATGTPKDLSVRLEMRLAEARVALSAGRLEEAATSFLAVEREAKRHDLLRVGARAREGRGVWLERLGKPEEALEQFQAAEEMLRTEPAIAKVDAVAGKARCFHSLGDLRYEIHLLESLLGSIEREGLPDPDALARVHSGLIFAYVEAGLLAKAADSAAILDSISARLMDPARVGQMHMNVARLLLVRGDVDGALRSLERAEGAFREAEFLAETGHAHLARGYVLSREGDLGQARAELEEARRIFDETGDTKDLARALNELGRLARLSGDLLRAREVLEQSLKLADGRDAPISAWTHRELGLVLADTDRPSAEKHFQRAIEQYELSEQPVQVALTWRALGDLLAVEEGEASAATAYRKGLIALDPLA